MNNGELRIANGRWQTAANCVEDCPQAKRGEDVDEGQEADGAQVAGGDGADGEGAGEEHGGEVGEEEDAGGEVTGRGGEGGTGRGGNRGTGSGGAGSGGRCGTEQADELPGDDGEAQEEQDGDDGIEKGAAGEVEADVGVTPEEEHPQAGADAGPGLGPTSGGDLLCAGQETAGVG